MVFNEKHYDKVKQIHENIFTFTSGQQNNDELPVTQRVPALEFVQDWKGYWVWYWYQGLRNKIQYISRHLLLS